MPTLHDRKIGQVVFAAGGRQTLEIDRAGVLNQLTLRLKYTVTNGGSAAVGPLFQALARLIKRVEIIMGGRDTVWSISGKSLAMLAHVDNMYPAYGMGDAVVLTGSAATTYDITIPLPFFLDNARRPDDTALDLRRVSQASIAITWGPTDCSDLYTTPNSAAISSVTCDVEGEYTLGAPNDQVYLVRAIDEIEEEITGNSGNRSLIVDRGSGLFVRRLFLTFEDAKIGADDVLNDVKLEAGSFIFLNRDPVQVKAKNKREYGLESLITGVYAFDETLFGQATSMINTGELTSDLKFVMDVTKGSGTTTVRLTREVVRPLKLA